MTSTTAPEAHVEAEEPSAPEAPEPQGRVLDRRRPREEDPSEVDDLDDLDEGYDDHDDEPPPEHRPRAYRPGRGGFDADAAAAAAQARYAFRQRVALGLIAVAVLSVLAALVVSTALWWLFAVTVVGLAGYLVFLRRQTRIEDEVRRRRLARLTGERRALEARRERQAEHEARLADADGWGRHPDDEYDDVDEADVPAARRGDAYEPDGGYDDGYDEPRWVAPRMPAPAVPDGMELVGDTDDDPDFCELGEIADERVPAFRRGA